MEYSSFSPATRDDQKSFILSMAATLFATLLTLISAGTGSGKSQNMADLSSIFLKGRTRRVAILLCPDERTAGQHARYYTESTGMTPLFLRSDDKRRTAGDIVTSIKSAKNPVLIVDNVGHRNGGFTHNTGTLRDVLRLLSDWEKLVNIDEGHDQNTSLCGGLNACTESTKDKMKKYKAVCDQKDSLNFYDVLHSAKARTVVWSATLNNLISSKLMTLGYVPEQTRLINIAPIPTLYSLKPFQSFDRDDPSTYWPSMQAIMAREGVILCVFARLASIKEFIDKHAIADAVCITSMEDKASLEKGALTERLKVCKFVCAVNMLNGAFDLHSYIGKNFSGIYVFRDSSDGGSNPLSKAPGHQLHHDISATMIQVVGRGRDDSVEINAPESHAGRTMLDIHREIYDIVAAAAGESFRYGPVSETQAGRYHHATYVALLHQQRPDCEDRPIIEEIFGRLQDVTGRDLRVECRDPACDHLFWRGAIEYVWQTIFLLTRHIREKELKRKERLRLTVPGGYRGGGITKPREFDPAVQEEVEKRANGRCCHCGDRLKAGEDIQDCHVKRRDAGGDYSIDNIMKGHRGCDGMFDDARLIHDPNGSHYWSHPTHTHGWEPAIRQLCGISSANICSRWSWAKKRLCPEAADFRAWLLASGYECKAYD